jgi:hypothetical protein
VRTFIVRLQEDVGGSDRGGAAPTPRLRGVVDEVATGLRATFRDQQELVSALMTAVSGDRPGRSDDANDLSGED